MEDLLDLRKCYLLYGNAVILEMRLSLGLIWFELSSGNAELIGFATVFCYVETKL